MTAEGDTARGPSRVAIVNWRDPWHPAAGGAERYAWELARRFRARGTRVRFLTSRAPGQARRERVEGVEIVRLGGRLTVYPLVLAWMLLRRRAFDAVLDCQNGIPFFTPWVLPRRVPVFCVVHHVHDEQFGVHFPAWLASAGHPRRAGRPQGVPAARLRRGLPIDGDGHAGAVALDGTRVRRPQRRRRAARGPRRRPWRQPWQRPRAGVRQQARAAQDSRAAARPRRARQGTCAHHRARTGGGRPAGGGRGARPRRPGRPARVSARGGQDGPGRPRPPARKPIARRARPDGSS